MTSDGGAMRIELEHVGNHAFIRHIKVMIVIKLINKTYFITLY